MPVVCTSPLRTFIWLGLKARRKVCRPHSFHGLGALQNALFLYTTAPPSAIKAGGGAVVYRSLNMGVIINVIDAVAVIAIAARAVAKFQIGV